MAITVTLARYNTHIWKFDTWTAGTYATGTYKQYTINSVLRVYKSLRSTSTTPTFQTDADWQVQSIDMYAGVYTGNGTYNTGDTVNLTATAKTGWVFVNWTDNADGSEVSTNANYSFTAPASNVSYTANFAMDTAYSVEEILGMSGFAIETDASGVISNLDNLVVESVNGSLGFSVETDASYVIPATEYTRIENVNGMLGASIEYTENDILFPSIKRLN